MKYDKLSKYLFFIIAIAAFVYIALRAYFLEITHDEAWSFRLVDIFYFNAMAGLANTHWLNSAFIKIWSIIIGNDAWMLRIHSVISFLVYLWFLFRFYKHQKTLSAKISLIALFFVNLFALEYFPLARGYALSLSFYLVSIFYAVKFLKSGFEISRFFNKSMFFGAIAIAANYATFFQYSAIIALLLFFIIKKEKSIKSVFKREYLPGLAFYSFTTIIAVTNLIIIDIYGNDLRFGADNSYIYGTLASIFVNIIYTNEFYPYAPEVIAEYKTESIILFTFLVLSLIFGILKKVKLLNFYNLLFFIPFTLSHIVHYLFGKPFPVGRTALVVFPAIALIIVYYFEEIKFKKLRTIISIFLLGIMFIPIIKNANLTHTIAWRYQSETKEVLDFLNKQKGCERVYLGMHTYATYYHYYEHINPEKFVFEAKTEKEFHYRLPESSELKTIDYIAIGKGFPKEEYDNCEYLNLVKVYDLSQIYIYEVVGL